MKRITAILVAIAALGLTSEAGAIGVGGAYWSTEDADSGYGIILKHRIKIVPMIGAELRGSWLSFPDQGPESDKSLSIYPLEAVGRLSLGLFYVGAGVSYNIFSIKDLDAENKAGGLILGGVDLGLAGLGVFGELNYRFVETKVESVDLGANGFGVNVGVTIGG